MQINWFTIIAQIINFLTLVWLLKRFLYKPVLKAIDEREKKVADQLSDAASKMAEAQKEQDDFQKKNEAFEAERAAKMNQVKDEAEQERQKLFEQVRKQSALLRLKLEEELKNEQQNLKDEIMQKTRQEVFAIAGKTLSDLAGSNLEEQAVHIFIDRLHALKDNEKKQFLEAFHSSTKAIVFKSAFALPETQRSLVEKNLKEIINEEATVTYEVNPELVSGIEMGANGYKLSWNIDAYLASMQNKLAALIPAD